MFALFLIVNIKLDKGNKIKYKSGTHIKYVQIDCNCTMHMCNIIEQLNKCDGFCKFTFMDSQQTYHIFDLVKYIHCPNSSMFYNFYVAEWALSMWLKAWYFNILYTFASLYFWPSIKSNDFFCLFLSLHSHFSFVLILLLLHLK